jgi:hypothetical protein
MQANAKTLGDVRPSVGPSVGGGFGPWTATSDARKERTNERNLAPFTLVLALEFKRGFCPGWLQRSRTNEKSGLARKGSRPHGWMDG